jgi:hypothetical protein
MEIKKALNKEMINFGTFASKNQEEKSSELDGMPVDKVVYD